MHPDTKVTCNGDNGDIGMAESPKGRDTRHYGAIRADLHGGSLLVGERLQTTTRHTRRFPSWGQGMRRSMHWRHKAETLQDPGAFGLNDADACRIILNSKLPEKLWAGVTPVAGYLINRIPHAVVDNKTPLFMQHEQRARLEVLQTTGA